MKNYEIGEPIEWTVGNIVSKGIVREDFEDCVEAIVYEINSQPTKMKLKVLKSILN